MIKNCPLSRSFITEKILQSRLKCNHYSPINNAQFENIPTDSINKFINYKKKSVKL